MQATALRVAIVSTTAADRDVAGIDPPRGPDSPEPRLFAVQQAGRSIGVVQATLDGTLLLITWLEIAVEYRNLGLGGEAVIALESLHPEARESRAIVPPGNGLAIYFWLRAGYRPLFAAASGAATATAMQRLLG